jgi:diguanylate cyclase (GGDEF)-like protein
MGFVVFALRPVLPIAPAVLLGNGLLFVGVVVYARALYRFLLDQPLPRWYWAMLIASLIVMLIILPQPIYLRASIVSFLYAALLVPQVVLIVHHGWFAEASLRTVALTMAMAVCALAVRGVHAWYFPQQYGGPTQMSLGQGLTFLVTFLSVLGAGFGFVLACFERVAQRMEQLASHDGLTGCVNRSTTDSLIDHELLRGQREGQPVALVMLDIDHFKQINDRFGHRSGDQVLRSFADTVRSRLRRSDILGRVGGEEFLLLLPATDAAGARQLADEVRLAVQDQPNGEAGGITLSGGVAVALPSASMTAERLYAAADRALYRAKNLGRNRIEVDPGTPGGEVLPGDMAPMSAGH